MTADSEKNQGNDILFTTGQQGLEQHTIPKSCCFTHKAAGATINDRSGFNRYDMDSKRLDDKLPTKHSEVILACQSVYRKIGMVRNIIDLMTDFASEGLELQHPIKKQQKFYRQWAKKVDLAGRVHDFMKLLMRDANVIVRRKNAYITVPVEKELVKGNVLNLESLDETAYDEVPEKLKVTKKFSNKRVIPWKYTFISPAIVEKTGGEIGKFFGSDSLGMKIPSSLSKAIKNPTTDAEARLVQKMPAEVVEAVKKGSSFVQLEMDRMYVDYYKKDDWEDWGTPFLYGVLEDIMLKSKMRLADMAALDGVINVIRLWKLGKSDQQILPTPAAVDKLIEILQSNVGGGVMDLVWNDMIDLKVEYPPTDKILGQDKYKSVNSDIVRGLGIPDSLVGGEDLGTRNAQSAFVQLKTLVERLEYVRGRAIVWLEAELRRVADAMGFKNIPSICFGTMSLRDEAAEKQLMIQLLDRGIISSEKATEVFGVNYMIELERMKDEQQVRLENPGILEKSNPYYRPFSLLEKQTELAIKLEQSKQSGGGDNLVGDQPRNDGINGPGRPPSTKDTGPRDSRTPKTMSLLNIAGENLYNGIDRIVDTNYLKLHGVKNIRSLTNAQKRELEQTKHAILSVMLPGDEITDQLIASRLAIASTKPVEFNGLFEELLSSFVGSTNRSPTLSERRMLSICTWASYVS